MTTLFFVVEIQKIVHTLLPRHAAHNDCEKLTFQRSVVDKIASNDDVQLYWTVYSHTRAKRFRDSFIRDSHPVGHWEGIFIGRCMDGRVEKGVNKTLQ